MKYGFSCNLTLTTARPSTAYFLHGFTGTMAAVSFPIKKSYTAPPVSGDTIFLFSASSPAMAPRQELSTFQYFYSISTALRFPFRPVCWTAPVTPYDISKTAERIKNLRKKAGYTQEQVADLLNVDRRTISNIEGGKKGCSVDMLLRLSELYGVTLDYLLKGDCGDRQQVLNLLNEMQTQLDMIRALL